MGASSELAVDPCPLRFSAVVRPMSTEAAPAAGSAAPTTPQVAAPAAVPSAPISMSILKVTKSYQQQHGLRHGDYQRYRRFCTARLGRIRKVSKLSHGRKGFITRDITPENAHGYGHVEFLLVKCERAWSYANELKMDAANNARANNHYHRRLVKAARHAEKLAVVCAARGDGRTKLEAEAYSCGMSALLQIEDKNWASGLEKLTRAKTIYENLSKLGDIDDQKLYSERTEDIEPNIRFCAYNLGGDRKAASQAAAAAGSGELMKKIEDALEESRKNQSKSVRELLWQGKTLHVKSEKLSEALLSAQEVLNELEKEQQALEKRFELYDRLFVAYNDAVRIARDEMTAKAKGSAKKTSKSEETVQSLESIIKYLTYQKLSHTFERNLLMVEQAQRRWNGDSTDPAEKQKRPPKAEDLVKLYETLIQNAFELGETAGTATDSAEAKFNAARVTAFKTWRCFFMSLSYAGLGKWPEAHALLERAGEQLLQARQQLSALPSSKAREAELQRLAPLDTRIRAEKSVLGAKAVLQQLNATSKTAPAVVADANWSLNSAQQQNQFSTAVVTHQKIVEFPPELQAVPCKPMLFDLALVACEFPSLDKRKEKSGGLFGFFKRA